MYKVNIRSNFSGSSIQKSNTKLKTSKEAIDWLNNNLGLFAPISERNENRILSMEPNSKVGFKVMNVQITVTRK